MDDATTRGHQVDGAGLDHRVAANAVAMLDRALEQIGDGREVDVRVRAHIHALARRHRAGPNSSTKIKGPTIVRSRAGRVRSNFELAEVVGDRRDRNIQG